MYKYVYEKFYLELYYIRIELFKYMIYIIIYCKVVNNFNLRES